MRKGSAGGRGRVEASRLGHNRFKVNMLKIMKGGTVDMIKSVRIVGALCVAFTWLFVQGLVRR